MCPSSSLPGLSRYELARGCAGLLSEPWGDKFARDGSIDNGVDLEGELTRNELVRFGTISSGELAAWLMRRGCRAERTVPKRL